MFIFQVLCCNFGTNYSVLSKKMQADVFCPWGPNIWGPFVYGDHLSMGTELAVDRIGGGPNFGGPFVQGDHIVWGPFVQRDQLIGDHLSRGTWRGGPEVRGPSRFGTKCVFFSLGWKVEDSDLAHFFWVNNRGEKLSEFKFLLFYFFPRKGS